MGIPVLDGVASFSTPYEVIICDLWGVVHNGLVAHDAALETLASWRADGKKVVLLSNAPRPYPYSIARMEPMGVTPEYYDHVITGGDLARSLVASTAFQDRTGVLFYHLGPDLNRSTFDGVGLTQVDDAGEADFVICTAFHNDRAESAEDYRAELEAHLERGLPHVCANPDLEVGQGDIITPCAGAISELYEQMGGKVHWCGKPDAMAYEACLEFAGEVQHANVLAVGDGLRTDILGANRFGIDSLFVSSGIHMREIQEAGGPAKAFDAYNVAPSAIIDRLKL